MSLQSPAVPGAADTGHRFPEPQPKGFTPIGNLGHQLIHYTLGCDVTPRTIEFTAVQLAAVVLLPTITVPIFGVTVQSMIMTGIFTGIASGAAERLHNLKAEHGSPLAKGISRAIHLRNASSKINTVAMVAIGAVSFYFGHLKGFKPDILSIAMLLWSGKEIVTTIYPNLMEAITDKIAERFIGAICPVGI